MAITAREVAEAIYDPKQDGDKEAFVRLVEDGYPLGSAQILEFSIAIHRFKAAIAKAILDDPERVCRWVRGDIMSMKLDMNPKCPYCGEMGHVTYAVKDLIPGEDRGWWTCTEAARHAHYKCDACHGSWTETKQCAKTEEQGTHDSYIEQWTASSAKEEQRANTATLTELEGE